MRRAAGDELELAGPEEAAEAVEQVVAVLLDEHVARALEAVVVHVGEVIELRLPAGALDLLAGQGDQVVDVADVAVLQSGSLSMAASVGVTTWSAASRRRRVRGRRRLRGAGCRSR